MLHRRKEQGLSLARIIVGHERIASFTDLCSPLISFRPFGKDCGREDEVNGRKSWRQKLQKDPCVYSSTRADRTYWSPVTWPESFGVRKTTQPADAGEGVVP